MWFSHIVAAAPAREYAPEDLPIIHQEIENERLEKLLK